MWLIKLYCSLFLLLPVILSAPLSQRVVSAVTRQWNYHGNDHSVQVSWHQPTSTPEEQRKDHAEDRKISSELEALMRTARPGPGDRWPHALSSLTSDMVEDLEVSLRDGDIISPKLSPEQQSASPLGSDHDSRQLKDISIGATASGETSRRRMRMRVIKYRYLTMFSRANMQPSPTQTLSDHSLSESLETEIIDSDEEGDFLSALLWITGRPIWSWAAIFTLAFVLFIASVIIVETTAVLVKLVKLTVGKCWSRRIQLEGAERNITALSPEEDIFEEEKPISAQT